MCLGIVLRGRKKKIKNSSWLKLFPYFEEFRSEFVYQTNQFTENAVIIALMSKYGIHRVRGGIYQEIILPLEKMKNIILQIG